MNVKTISRMLLAFSAVMIYMAMTMDTTVSTGYGYVHNIGLQSEQTNMLILGGIGFIAGIILFSTSKVKQTKQEEDDEKAAIEANISKVGTTAKTAINSAGSAFQSWWKGFDNIIGRAAVFILIVFNLELLVELIAKIVSLETRSDVNSLFLLMMFAVGAYLLVPRPATKLAIHIFIANAALWVFVCSINLTKYFNNGEMHYLKVTLVSLFVVFISTGIVWLLRNVRNKIAN